MLPSYSLTNDSGIMMYSVFCGLHLQEGEKKERDGKLDLLLKVDPLVQNSIVSEFMVGIVWREIGPKLVN